MTENLSVRLDREARAWADWNAEHPDNQSPTTEALLREAAALARRVEESPVAIFASHDVDAPPVGCEWDASIASVNGQRVALVPVEGGA